MAAHCARIGLHSRFKTQPGIERLDDPFGFPFQAKQNGFLKGSRLKDLARNHGLEGVAFFKFTKATSISDK